MLMDEPVVRVVADINPFAEVTDFHPAVLDQPDNLAPNLIGVVRDGLAFDIDIG